MKFIEYLSKFFSKNTNNAIIKRAELDFILLHKKTKGKFAILSVDLQAIFIEELDKKKQETLILYHKTLREIAEKNNIPFILIEKNNNGKHILRDKNSTYFVKEGYSALDMTQLDSYLQRKGYKMLYVIGLTRTICIFSTIRDLKKKSYEIFTSIIGTGAGGDYRRLFNDENEEKLTKKQLSAKKEFQQYYGLDENTKLTLKKELQEFQKLDVKIIDYLYK